MLIREMILRIRERPKMFLPRPGVHSLSMFLSGYEFAMKDSVPDIYHYLGDFNRYITKQYPRAGTQGWVKVIEFYSPDQEYEMYLFWKHFDEFDKKQKDR